MEQIRTVRPGDEERLAYVQTESWKAAFREIVQHEPYPVESKARDILQKLKEGGITRFLLLFRGSRSRSEVVATFLAVLELCKARVLHLAGSETDCTVRQERDDVPENLTF